MTNHQRDIETALVTAYINKDMSPKDRRILIYRSLRAVSAARYLLRMGAK